MLVTGNTLTPPQPPDCTLYQTTRELPAADTAASVTLHFCCTAPVAHAAATRPSPSSAFSITTVQNARGPKDSSTAGCWYNPDFVGPETLSVCTGLHRGAQWVAHPHRTPLPAVKQSTPCLKSPIIIIQKYHKLLQYFLLMSWLYHAPLLYATAGALRAGQQRGSERQITAG